MERWLGIDPGTRRIGVAVGSAKDRVATPLTVLPASPLEAAAAGILQLAREYQAEGIVVGWPINMDGSEGPQAHHARQFARRLAAACLSGGQATGLDVRLWDERLTSFSADKALAGLWTRKQKRARQDAVAAAHLLEQFFLGQGPRNAPRPDDPPVRPPEKGRKTSQEV